MEVDHKITMKMRKSLIYRWFLSIANNLKACIKVLFILIYIYGKKETFLKQKIQLSLTLNMLLLYGYRRDNAQWNKCI